ncbi:MAG: saccharopine dehydrogenase NADP-binding domain-containing protein [Archaeoglobaceae archaeon]|nr:saccharopine dehydrogenase NADP-binding domain-containing protein [Archaeoglobaceae archaeon]
MSKIAVLGGAGHIGSRIVKEIMELDPSSNLTICDINLDKARELERELGNIEVVKTNATREEELLDVMKKKDVVVNAVGPFYKFGVPILKSAIRSKVNYVDINDDYDSTIEALNFKQIAEERGVTAIIGMGATPGITNLLAKKAVEIMDEVEEIGTYWIWTALDPTMGTAIVEHYFHAITGFVKTYRNGEFIEVRALSEPELFDFPAPIGRWEVAHVGHPEPVTIPRYVKVKNVFNKGGIWPAELNQIAKIFSEMGLTGDAKLNIKGQHFNARELAVMITMSLAELIPPEVLQSILGKAYERLGEFALTGVGIGVTVKGKLAEEDVEIKYRIACKEASLATALPCAVTALKLAKSELKKGVFPPESGVVNISEILEEIKKRFRIECTEVRNYLL